MKTCNRVRDTGHTTDTAAPSAFAAALARRRAQAERQRADDLAEGLAHGRRLAELIVEEKGPATNVINSDQYGTRVVFPSRLGYLSVSRGGDVSILSRGRQTLFLSSMYRSWRQAFERALRRYNKERGETEEL